MTDASQGIFYIPIIPGRQLPGGENLPSLGIGMPVGSEKPDASAEKSALLRAIELGYTHFQTDASSYLEALVGESIAESLASGRVSREEFFVTSKISFHSVASAESIITSLTKSLETMKLEYVDIFIIEWSENGPKTGGGFVSAWDAMEQCRSLGLAKLIGVSNFSLEMLESLLKLEKTIPSVNQVGMNPMWKSKELRDFSAANNIAIIVSSTIDGNDEDFDFTQFMESEAFQKIAKDLNKTPAEIYFRWAYEQGASLLLESLNRVDIRKMLNVFEWELPRDM